MSFQFILLRVFHHIFLFMCTYVWQMPKSEAEYRIDTWLILHSDLLIAFLFLFVSVDIWCCNVGKKKNVKSCNIYEICIKEESNSIINKSLSKFWNKVSRRCFRPSYLTMLSKMFTRSVQGLGHLISSFGLSASCAGRPSRRAPLCWSKLWILFDNVVESRHYILSLIDTHQLLFSISRTCGLGVINRDWKHMNEMKEMKINEIIAFKVWLSA